MTPLTQIHADRARLRAIEAALDTDLTLDERCDLQDEALDIKERLGEFERSVQDNEDCEYCSG